MMSNNKIYSWEFALKYTLALFLSWYIPSYLGFDKPYWSMMTVAIISYPNVSLSFAKMGARLIGSLIGVIAVTVIANVSLNDYWWFSSLIILWVSLCLFLSSISKYMMPYLFSLSGYTSAIIAFGASLAPTPTTIFTLSQERLIEIMIGILVYSLIMKITPHNRIKLQTDEIKKDITHLKTQLLASLVKKNKNQTLNKLNEIIANVIAYDEFNTYENKFSIVNTPIFPINKINSQITFVIIALANKSILSYHTYKDFIFTSCKANHENNHRPSYFIFIDWTNAALNMLRLFIGLFISLLFWLNSGWDYGFVLPILVSISFTFGVSFPKVNMLAFIVMGLSIIAITFSYILKFYFLIQAESPVQAWLILFPLFLILGLLKSGSKLLFLASHVLSITIIFLINFTNPMNYDFLFFANISLGIFLSIIIVILLLFLIPFTSEQTLLKYRCLFTLNKITDFIKNPQHPTKLNNTILITINKINAYPNKYNHYLNTLYVLHVLISLHVLMETSEHKNLLLKAMSMVIEKYTTDDIIAAISQCSLSSSAQDNEYLRYAIGSIKYYYSYSQYQS